MLNRDHFIILGFVRRTLICHNESAKKLFRLSNTSIGRDTDVGYQLGDPSLNFFIP